VEVPICSVEPAAGHVKLRVRLEPPLWLGLERAELPLTGAAVLGAGKRLGRRSLHPDLALRWIRIVYRELVKLPSAGLVALSDDEVVLVLDGVPDDAELSLAANALQSLARTAVDLSRVGVAPWRRGIERTWAEAAVQLQALFDAPALSLRFARNGRSGEARVQLAPELSTIVRVDRRDADASDIAALSAFACIVEVGYAEVVVRRRGLVADADALIDLVDATYAWLDGWARPDGPYRG